MFLRIRHKIFLKIGFLVFGIFVFCFALSFLVLAVAPTAYFECDDGPLNCGQDHPLPCISYDENTICVMEMLNGSTQGDDGPIVSSKWFIDNIEKDSCSGLCNFTPGNYVGPPLDPPANVFYTIKLEVSDGGSTDFMERSYEHRSGTMAGFRCSEDNSDWTTDCEDMRISVPKTVYFKANLGDSWGDDNSYPSCCGHSINSWTWRRDGGFFANGSAVSYDFTAADGLKIHQITLEISDSNGKSDTVLHTIMTGEPLVPIWIETKPN